MKYRVKHLVEYAMIRLIAWLIQHLPYRCGLVLAWTIGALIFYGFRFRRAEVLRRIRTVFGDQYTEREMTRIAWNSFRNLLFTGVEAIRMPLRQTLPEQVRNAYADAMRQFQAIQQMGKGAILACPHMGSWETAAGICHQAGISMFSIAGQQRNPLFDAYLNRLRASIGNEICMRGSTSIRGVVDRLKTGKFLAVLPDTRSPTPGVQVRFLGGTANVTPGIVLFARHAAVPILPVINTRRGWTKRECRCFPPIWPDPGLTKHQDYQRICQQFFDIVEQTIRKDPGQWFWFNKRWILDPLDSPAPPEDTLYAPNR